MVALGGIAGQIIGVPVVFVHVGSGEQVGHCAFAEKIPAKKTAKKIDMFFIGRGSKYRSIKNKNFFLIEQCFQRKKNERNLSSQTI